MDRSRTQIRKAERQRDGDHLQDRRSPRLLDERTPGQGHPLTDGGQTPRVDRGHEGAHGRRERCHRDCPHRTPQRRIGFTRTRSPQASRIERAPRVANRRKLSTLRKLGTAASFYIRHSTRGSFYSRRTRSSPFPSSSIYFLY